jgi:hypothetical protein
MDESISKFLMNIGHVNDLMALLLVLRDEEVIANGCKCIRICLRDEKVTIKLCVTLMYSG